MPKQWTCCLLLLLIGLGAHAQSVLVEAESFDEPGGWKLDTQFLHVMGSPYPAGARAGAAGRRRDDDGRDPRGGVVPRVGTDEGLGGGVRRVAG